MFLARVVGVVWSTVKWSELEGLKLLLVRPYSLEALSHEGRPTSESVVVGDTMGAGPGEDVIIAYGHAARVAVQDHLPEGVKPATPIDAAVVAIVDRYHVDPEQVNFNV